MARSKKTDQQQSPSPVKGSVITAIYKKTHVMDKLAEAVSKTVRNGDLATPVDPALFVRLCKANQIDAERWAHVNIGMRVMNLTNVLRARAARKETVVTTLTPRKPRGSKKTTTVDETPATVEQAA